MGNDKRSFPRSLVELAVKVKIDGGWTDCKIQDLSVEGISLEVGKPLQMGEVTTIEIEDSEWMQKNQVKAEILRCDSNPNETEPDIFHVVAMVIKPNDEYLTAALNLVHGDGPKKDRRKPGFENREDGR